MVRDCLAILSFFLLAALYFGDVLSGEYLLNERDLNEFFIPPRQFWVEEIRHLRVPLWNPFVFAGHPLFATLQTGVLYPFSLLYFILPFPIAFNGTIVLHFSLAGIFSYALIRGMGAGRGAGLIAGFSFMLSGYLLSVHNLLSTLFSVTWVPLFLLVYFSAFGKKDLRYALLSGLVGTLMFLGGGVEVCFFTFGLALVLTLFPGMVLDPAGVPAARFRLTAFTVFVCSFFGLSAIQSIPFFELTGLSIRSAGLSYEEATTWSLHPWDLLEFLVPDLYGLATDFEKYWTNQNWLKSIYLGGIPFLLSLFFFRNGGRRVPGYLLILFCSLILAMGRNTPVYPFLYEHVPFFDKMRFPVKFIFPAILVLSIMAGLGYDQFRKALEADPLRVRRLARFLLAFGVFLMVLFGVLNIDSVHQKAMEFAGRMGLDHPRYNSVKVNLFNLKRVLAFTGLCCLLVFLSTAFPKQKKMFLAGISILLALDLFFANQGFYRKVETDRYVSNSSNMDFLLSDPSRFRIFIPQGTLDDGQKIVMGTGKDGLDIRKEKVIPNLGVPRGIFDASGASVTRQMRHLILFSFLNGFPSPQTVPLLNLMNIKYVISIPPIPYPPFKLVHMNLPMEGDVENLEKIKTIKVYENPRVLPRAFLVGNCRLALSAKETRRVFLSGDFHPDELVLLDEAPEGFSCGEHKLHVGKTGDSVEMTRYESNSVELQVNLNSKKFLFLSESYYPGWKAWVDGRPAKIYRADYLFRAVLLDPGTHRVRFEYRPVSVILGAIISALALLVCVVCFIKGRPARTLRLGAVS